MLRKHFLHKITATAALLVTANYAALAQALHTAGFTVTMLTKDIGVFTEKGGTILFAITGKGIIIVDSQFQDTATHLIDELSKLTSKPYKYLINTHHHADHTSGNIAFKGKLKHIVAHTNSAINQKAAAIKQKTEEKQLYPTTTWDSTWQVYLKTEKIICTYYGAAHTNGDIVVWLSKANIVHCGDLVFNRRFPYIDKANGANIKSWIQVLQKLQANYTDDTKYVFGHCNDKYSVVGTKADIKAFETYLTQLYNYVLTEYQLGKTKDAILKSKIIPGNQEWYGDGVERGLAAAYQEVDEEAKGRM